MTQTKLFGALRLCMTAGVVSLTRLGYAAPGDLDPSFAASVTNYPVVDAIALMPDSRILVAGNFTLADNWSEYSVARVYRDGSLDTAFNAGFIDSAVDCLALDPDGHILIGGYFQHINGAARYYVARLDSAGNLDTTFNPGRLLNGEVFSIALQTNGAVVIGGFFSAIGTNQISGVARLTAAGQLDTNFHIGSGTYGVVYAVVLQPDSRLLIAGNFSLVNGTARRYIARLNTDGTLDAGFNADFPSGGASDGIYAMALQPDGKILVGGQFAITNAGIARGNLARLNADGTVDTTFSAAASPNGRVYAVALQSEGRVMVSGYFGGFGSTQQIGIARLYPDGTLDGDFKGILAWWGTIEEYPQVLVPQPDNKVLIGGSFDTVDGVRRGGIARLLGDPPPVLTSITGGPSRGVLVTGQAATNAHLRIDASPDLNTWSLLVELTNTSGRFTFQDPAATNALRFYRAAWLP